MRVVGQKVLLLITEVLIIVVIIGIPLTSTSQPIIVPQKEVNVDSLLVKIDTLEGKVESFQQRFNSFDRLLTFLGGIFAIIVSWLTIRDILAFRNSRSMEKAARESVQETTGLISTLKDSFQYQDEVTKLREEVKELEQQRNTERVNETKFRQDLNERAFEIANKITRDNYKSHYYSQIFRNFRNTLNKVVEEDPVADEELNPNCFQILALDLIIQDLFEEALEILDHGIQLSIRFAQEPPDNFELYYPNGVLRKDKSESWNQKLTNILYYHKAIIYYNLGQHSQQARQYFQMAIKYDENDINSKMYIPEGLYLEAKYNGKLNEHGNIVAGFKELEKEMVNISENVSSNWGKKKNIIQSLFYVRFGNIYLPTSMHNRPRSFNGKPSCEDLGKAGWYYQYAMKLDPTSYLAMFSYAQALILASKSDGTLDEDKLAKKNNAQSLFRKVFDLVQTKTGSTIEAKIQIMYFYILVICCVEGELEGEQEKRYLTKIFEKEMELPKHSNYRIFSPLTKNDLTYNELVSEIKNYIKVAKKKIPA